MAYQILNYLGDVVLDNISDEELESLKSKAIEEDFNYFLYDPNPDQDLVKRWEEEKEFRIVHNFRIIKKLD